MYTWFTSTYLKNLRFEPIAFSIRQYQWLRFMSAALALQLVPIQLAKLIMCFYRLHHPA